MKIKAWKGGRNERVYARMTKEAKAKLLARVKAEGYKSLGDWLEAQAETQLTPRALDECPSCDGEGTGFSEGESWTCSVCDGTGIRQ